MDANVVRQLNRLKKEAESIEKFNFDKFERLLKKYKSANSNATNYDICKTLRGIRLAVEHQNHSDNDVKRKAAKVIKSAGHSIENVKISLRPFRTVLDIVEVLEVGKTSTPKCFSARSQFQTYRSRQYSSTSENGTHFWKLCQMSKFRCRILSKHEI